MERDVESQGKCVWRRCWVIVRHGKSDAGFMSFRVSKGMRKSHVEQFTFAAMQHGQLTLVIMACARSDGLG
jgi:hypothetical protein